MLGKKIGGVITTYSKVVATRAVPCHAGCSLADPSDDTSIIFSHCGRTCLVPQAKCLKVKLFSEANTGYFYTWKKNPKAYPWRIALRKYDPIVRKHVLFKVRDTRPNFARRAACLNNAGLDWWRVQERKGGFMTLFGL